MTRRAVLTLLVIVPVAVAGQAAGTHQFVPERFYNTFSFAHPPALRIKPGDRVVTKTVDAGGVIHIKPVKLGRDFGKEVEILAGLSDSDHVINNPRDSLVEGLKVKATEMTIAHGDKKEGAKPASAPTEKPKS